MKEEDLYNPIRDYFVEKGFRVNGEVLSCDVTAIKDELLIIIELKKTLSVTLLAQAVDRQRISDLVYVAIPKPIKFKSNGKWKDTLLLLKRLEVGLIFVDLGKKKPIVEIILEPVLFDRGKSISRSKKRREQVLNEINGRKTDLNKGGSSRVKLMTAYRESCLYVACCLDLFGDLSTKQLRALGCDSKKLYGILRNNHYLWFETIEKGIYAITPVGRDALLEYDSLCNELKDTIMKLIKDTE